jgi:hypothetical protein
MNSVYVGQTVRIVTPDDKTTDGKEGKIVGIDGAWIYVTLPMKVQALSPDGLGPVRTHQIALGFSPSEVQKTRADEMAELELDAMGEDVAREYVRRYGPPYQFEKYDVLQSKNGKGDDPWQDFSTLHTAQEAGRAMRLVDAGKWEGEPLEFRIVRKFGALADNGVKYERHET